MNHALVDDIRFQARVRPQALAVFGPHGPVTYATLVHDVDALATELLERNLTRRDMVGLHLGFSYLHVLLMLALDRISVASITLPAAGDAPPAIAPQHGVSVVISGRPAPATPPCRWITLADHQRPKLGPIDTARLGALDAPADAVLRVIWSSGTTGGIKGTPLDRTMLARRLMLRRLLHGVGPHTRAFTGMPFSTPPGYLMVLASLAAGGSVILPNPAVDFVTYANLLGVTATVASPAVLATLIGKGRLETVDSLEVVGANLSAKLAQEARATLTANLSIDYGTSETGRIAGGDAALAIADPTAAGFVIPWIDLEIVDAAERPLPPGQEGRLRVRGAQVIAGYHRDEAATRRNFRNGWFYPGDLGVVSADGLLRVTGRVEDVIRRSDTLVSPVPIEEVIAGVPGVRDVAVFGLDDPNGTQEICAALVLEPGADTAAIRGAAAAQLGDRMPARLLVLDQLPRNENGKVMRRTLVALATQARG
jgi:acyl-CoA synthetase (AMP-forming)/AMP-acid ligase II